jgi:hypothetical protein
MACATHAGASSLDDVMRGLQDIKEMAAERFGQTRQASKIQEAELRQLKTLLKCRVVWADGDPTLQSLLGPEPAENSAAWW